MEHAPRTPLPKMGCGYAVCVALALAGVALLGVANAKWNQRQRTDAWVAGGCGAALCLAGVGLVAPMRREVARAQERRRREAAKPDQPWTWEPAWLNRSGITQASGRGRGARLLFALLTVPLSIPAVAAMPRELARGNHAIWAALLFPIVGLSIFGGLALESWRRRKYGTARFVAERMPVPLGGELVGMIVVDRPIIASGAARVSLVCWQSAIEGGPKRTRREMAVGQAERELGAGDWTTTAHESRLFVRLPVRGGAASTLGPVADEAPGYEWRLHIAVPTAGADFVAEFVLPVFAVAGADGKVSGGPARVADAAEERRRQADRVEIWRAAGIREEAQAGATGGNALVMPAGIGRRWIAGPLAMAVGSGVLAGVLWLAPIPGIFAIFLGAFALLPALTLPSLWSGGGERVWIEPEGIRVQRGMSAPQQIASSEVESIAAAKNVGVGTQQFFRIVARCTPRRAGRLPRRETVAAMVRGEEEAAEVVAWLEERLTGS